MNDIKRNNTQQRFDDLLNAIDQDINSENVESMSKHVSEAKLINKQLLDHDTKAFDEQQSSINMLNIQDDVLMKCLMQHYQSKLEDMQHA